MISSLLSYSNFILKYIILHIKLSIFLIFISSNGLFEYIQLSFGFCEHTKFLETRFVYIWQSLIRENKVIHIDKIFSKSCQCLKCKIEYVDCIIYRNRITLIGNVLLFSVISNFLLSYIFMKYL
jgi:hypothetical protein